MITEAELLKLLGEIESFGVERTVSVDKTDKFAQAICAFANDMAASGLPGYLLIGADDKTGAPSGLKVTDQLLQNLQSLASNGTILPAPAIIAYRMTLSSGLGEIAVVEVQPSSLPPVRYKGQAWIRRGPAKGIANEVEETILIERRTAAAKTFDAQPCVGAGLADLALDLFTTNYRPQAIDPEIIAENHRPIENQLASLRFFDLGRNQPTHAGLILFAKDILGWLPNAYILFVQYDGTKMSDDPISEKHFQGDLLSVIRDLNAFVSLITNSRPERISPLEERMVSDYPEAAVRELLMNAILHRSYDSGSPVRFLQFTDRIEIQNPGTLYGEARPENFPRQTSYRNPIIAEAMKTLGVVNRYGRGVERAQALLSKNGSPPAEFEFGNTFFGVTIRIRP
jgi:ATP-dependent DNA helicase RecG